MPKPQPVDLLITNAAMITCRKDAEDLVGYVPDGSVAVSGERIVAAGQAREIAAGIDTSSARITNANGNVVMPGFVDCHTHVVFGSSRVDEYVARLTGGDLDRLREQGMPVGITGTVRETAGLDVDGLVEQTLPRLAEMLVYGTTTTESKSGYGLTVESEIRILGANWRLKEQQPVDVVSTFLGAHALPAGVPRERYVETIIEEMIPRVAEDGLAEFCDVFCEEGYFTVEETRRILEAGIANGLRPKIHLDQYHHTGAARVATDLRCTSVDHLNYTTSQEMRELAEVGVVGVAMPALDFAVAHPRPVDCRAIIDSGMTLALATDICPGCWLTSMQFVINLACRQHGVSPAEAIRASTLGAATAIDRADEVGSLEPGKLADILILDVDRYEDLAYRLGRNAVQTAIKRGKTVFQR